MASLENQPVNTTYQSIVKLSDNGTVPASVGEQLSDGLGNPIPMKVSTNSVQFTAACQVQTPTLADHATRKDYVDSADSTLQANINQVENDLTDLINNEEAARITADSTLQNNIDNLELIDLADTPSTYGTAGQVLATNSTADGTEWITVSGGGGGAVDSVNGLTGALTIAGVNGIAVTTSGTDVINLDGQAFFTSLSSEIAARAAADLALQNAIDALEAGTGNVISVNGDTGDVQVEAVYQTVKNASGAIMYRGTPVHTTGVTSGQQPDVVPADASSNYPADYILNEDINAGASGQAITMGLIEDVDLTPFGGSASAFSPGDEVYLAAGGGFTIIRPTGTNAVQPLGRVLKVNVGGNQISGKIDNLGHADKDDHGLPNLPLNHVWEGNLNGVPQAVNQNTLNVASAVTAQQATSAVSSQTSLYADEAADVKIDAIGAGTFRVILGDDGQGSGAYQRLKSDVGNGFTYNPSGDVVSAGAFSATNNVTAGGTLAGVTLDISGGADIDGTLTLGSIGNVEGEINDLNTFVSNYNEFSQIVTETATITLDDINYSSYKGKTIIMTSATAVDVELDFTSAPVTGDEFYVVQGGAGAIGTINYGGAINSAAGTSPTTRAQWSGAVFKYLGSGDWLVMGDIE